MIMKNTRAMADKILNDIKLFSKLYLIISEFIYIAFLIYLIASKSGIFHLNVTLLCISTLFETFVIFSLIKSDFLTREHTRAIKHLYRISKLSLRAISLGIAVYGMGITLTEADTPHLLFTVFMLFSWILGVLIELFTFVIERYTDLITTAFAKDIEPFKKAGSIFTFKRHEKREETDIDYLVDEITQEYQSKIAAKKEAEKAVKEAERIIRKEERKEAFLEKASAAKSKIKSLFKRNDEE